MVGGKGRNDGVTIFGSSNNQADNNFNKNIDFFLNLNQKNNYPYLFTIFFNKETKSYIIRPYSSENNDNRILYVKLTNGNNLPLKQKEIISCGNIFFILFL